MTGLKVGYAQSPASTGVAVTVRAHWVNAWVLYAAAVPFISIDGIEHRCRWRVPTEINTAPGTHTVQTYIKYKGTTTPLGAGQISATVTQDNITAVESRNGPLNGSAFTPHLAAVTKH